MKQTFYSNGKLLLTGEYVVLDGAKALALPTKFGQDLTVEPGENKEITWTGFDSDGAIWIKEVIAFEVIANKEYVQKNDSVRNTLIEILHEAYLKKPEYIDASEGYAITTTLTFPRVWGLGTSSTLINNIAQWLSLDAFELLKNSFGGSGYDIAAAQNNSPVVYQLADENAVVTPVDFHPGFSKNLYFVYLNRKQSSKMSIKAYYNNRRYGLQKSILAINQITDLVLAVTETGAFARLLQKHELLMADLLQMDTAKQAYFPDFNGTVKSLGGWGGDFVLAVSKDDPTDYFKSKGFETVVPYDEMILK